MAAAIAEADLRRRRATLTGRHTINLARGRGDVKPGQIQPTVKVVTALSALGS